MHLTTLHSGGSQLIWIAPSGGRDRPDPSTGEWYPVYSLACQSCSFILTGSPCSDFAYITDLLYTFSFNVIVLFPSIEKELLQWQLWAWLT